MPTIKGKLRKKVKKKTRHNGNLTSYKPEFDVIVYKVLSRGGTKKEAAAVVGVNATTFFAWTKTQPSFSLAIQAASDDIKEPSLKDYVVGRLDPKIKYLWDELEKCEDTQHPIAMIEALLKNKGTRARQSLFVHAWVSSCFSISRALRKVNITKTVFDGWCKEVPFQMMVKEIHWHKKNFMEEALMGCVARGETSAIIFVNKTVNRDRGYQEKIELEMGDTINPAIVSVAALNLSLEEKRTALEAIRNKRAELKKIDGEVLA